jgi:hypothetical protein
MIAECGLMIAEFTPPLAQKPVRVKFGIADAKGVC